MFRFEIWNLVKNQILYFSKIMNIILSVVEKFTKKYYICFLLCYKRGSTIRLSENVDRFAFFPLLYSLKSIYFYI